jgi:rhamnosyltransferase
MAVSRLTSSVVVRTRDSAATVERTLQALRRQTMPCEIVVVDSGSRDGTLAIVRRYADQLVELPRGAFTYGRALNRGAALASGEVHFALSSHCAPERGDWIERSAAHFARPEVAGAMGALYGPLGDKLTGPVDLDASSMLRNPYWGFSNYASAWRGAVWRDEPFDETLGACEDKEWSWRVMRQGYVISFDPMIHVPAHHVREENLRAMYRRSHRESLAVAACLPELVPPTFGVSARRWFEAPGRTVVHRTRRRLQPSRIVVEIGRHTGERAGARRRGATPV